ncbi:hypothetical protein DQ384_17590 [Sphaerisporangium album]|uniref:Uncharacterized protein n=1 Tax=Sphaerisporangium album TaxID=509200 RepID=A0A367FHW8_9ACTN|nr:hypothetical protein DQ384_17590 [Sphaerisporangium album]
MGGYFPGTSGPRTQGPSEAVGRTVGGGRLFAVAMVTLSWTEHAVPWSLAVPGATTPAACGIRARVVDISGSRVIWMPGVLMCEECATVVTGSRDKDGLR